MTPPIALLGNGPVEESFGESIDRYATVIRCNNFQLDGFQDRVGSRITHWCINGIVDPVCYLPKWCRSALRWPDRRLKGIFPNPHVDDTVTVFCPQAFNWMIVESCRKRLMRDVSCVEDSSLLYPIHAASPFPTIGFSACHLLLSFHERISVFGFNGLRGGHYWNHKAYHNKGHRDKASNELDLIRACERIDFFPVPASSSASADRLHDSTYS